MTEALIITGAVVAGFTLGIAVLVALMVDFNHRTLFALSDSSAYPPGRCSETVDTADPAHSGVQTAATEVPQRTSLGGPAQRTLSGPPS